VVDDPDVLLAEVAEAALAAPVDREEAAADPVAAGPVAEPDPVREVAPVPIKNSMSQTPHYARGIEEEETNRSQRKHQSMLRREEEAGKGTNQLLCGAESLHN
jgi:hypothetical protein